MCRRLHCHPGSAHPLRTRYVKSHDYYVTIQDVLSSPYGTLSETKVLVGVTIAEVDQFVVERQMLAI